MVLIDRVNGETGLMDVAKLFNLGYRWEENVRSLQRRVFEDYGE